MFMEEVPNYKFTGLSWLFMGVANSDAKLYDDEFQAIAKKFPKQVRHHLRSGEHTSRIHLDVTVRRAIWIEAYLIEQMNS